MATQPSLLLDPIIKTPNGGGGGGGSSHPVHKTLATASALAHLLPTGTVLAFRALTPAFANNGSCHPANKYLTGILVLLCGLFCFLSSFTDTFLASSGKCYYGFATFKGLYIFNRDINQQGDEEDNEDEMEKVMKEDTHAYRITLIDFVHAFLTVLVFLIFAISDSDVKKCFFVGDDVNIQVLMENLPLGAGVLASFLFMLFPSTRRGIGHVEMPSLSK